MGASAHEIDGQIKETRDRLDENLGALEQRATSNAVRFGKIAAVIAGAAALGAGGFLLYRRFRRPSLKDRLQGMSLESLKDMADETAAYLKERVPSVTLTINDRSEAQPGTLESIIRKVAPAIVGTASTAIIDRVTRSSGAEGDDEATDRRATRA